MIDLKALAGKKYRISLDESTSMDRVRDASPWYYQILGKYGHVWVAGKETLAFYCDHPRVTSRLLAIPGVKVRQRGDYEVNASFPTERLDEVCTLLQARRRRQVSEAEKERLRNISGLSTYRASLTAQDEAEDERLIDSTDTGSEIDPARIRYGSTVEQEGVF